MKIALATLATGSYIRGAEVLFHTLRTVGKLPDHIDQLVLGVDSCKFATAVPIPVDYSWIPVNQQNFANVMSKLFVTTLDYDRVILLDSDMMCTDDCSYLWSDNLGKLAFYACRDTAGYKYYTSTVAELDLNANLMFNTGATVWHRVDTDDIIKRIRSFELKSYDGSDQGYLNSYFQHVRPSDFGWLPPEYNCCLDMFMPQVPDYAKRLIHFCGNNANPWTYHVPTNDWRAPYYETWDRLANVCDCNCSIVPTTVVRPDITGTQHEGVLDL